jgi:ribulose 1,5-bisphosphate synthetase/thiazole synthase
MFLEERQRKIPITYSCDVLVVGGGTAGVVAALAAAETGAKTILIEKGGFLGGVLLHGAICLHSFFNLYRPFPERSKIQLVRGIPEKIVQAMQEAGGCPGHLDVEIGYNYDSIATTFDPEIFKKVAFDLMEKAGVKLLMHTFMVDAITENGVIKGIVAESKSGREAILARVVVDTTGDGDVAFRANVPCEDRHSDYAVANVFGMGNVDVERLLSFLTEAGVLTHLAFSDSQDGRKHIVRLGMNLQADKRIGDAVRNLGIWGPVTVSHHRGELTYINCTSVRKVNPVNRDDMTRAEILLRRQIFELSSFLRKNVPGFADAYVNRTSPQICVRRTRTVMCEYDITLSDITEGRGFHDEIARYGFHDMAPRYVVDRGGSYGIPYRAIVPKAVDNLLVAGRMITSSYEAHMSTRNSVSCMAQGHAAGTAAALAALTGSAPRNLPISDLQDLLESQDVYLQRR